MVQRRRGCGLTFKVAALVVSRDQGNPTLRPEAHGQVANPMRNVGAVARVIRHESVRTAVGAELLHANAHRLARGSPLRGIRAVPGGPVRVPSERPAEQAESTHARRALLREWGAFRGRRPLSPFRAGVQGQEEGAPGVPARVSDQEFCSEDDLPKIYNFVSLKEEAFDAPCRE